jgi:hypothetical protein
MLPPKTVSGGLCAGIVELGSKCLPSHLHLPKSFPPESFRWGAMVTFAILPHADSLTSSNPQNAFHGVSESAIHTLFTGTARHCAGGNVEMDVDRDTCEMSGLDWPDRPTVFPELMTPVEAAQYLRLDETGHHTPATALRTMTYWRDHRVLRATKYARRIWFLKSELDQFLRAKTES